jgi:hypothetical protein
VGSGGENSDREHDENDEEDDFMDLSVAERREIDRELNEEYRRQCDEMGVDAGEEELVCVGSGNWVPLRTARQTSEAWREETDV